MVKVESLRLNEFLRPGVRYIFLSFVINIASVFGKDFINLRPSVVPSEKAVVDSASQFIELFDTIVTLLSSFSTG